MLQTVAKNGDFSRAVNCLLYCATTALEEALRSLSSTRAIELIARNLCDHQRDRFIIIGDLSDNAMRLLQHRTHPTNYRAARREQPTDLGFEVISARDLQVPLEPARLCVTDVSSSNFQQIIDAIDAWNSSPECHTSPLAAGGTVCDCFVPHHAFEAAIVIADWDCEQMASTACPGWVVIDLRDLESLEYSMQN